MHLLNSRLCRKVCLSEGSVLDNVDLFFFNESDALNFASNSIESIPPY